MEPEEDEATLRNPSVSQYFVSSTKPNQVLLTKHEAQFMVLDWGEKVDYGIGLSYRPIGYRTYELDLQSLWALCAQLYSLAEIPQPPPPPRPPGIWADIRGRY